MLMAAIPALRAGSSALSSQMPAMVSAVKTYAPGAMAKLANLTGSSSPVALATSIADNKNGAMAQGLIFNALRAGVTLDMIAGAVPALKKEDLEALATYHRQYAADARSAVDLATLHIPASGAPAMAPASEITLAIERTVSALGLSTYYKGKKEILGSDQLLDLIVAFKTIGPSDISQYQRYERSINRTPK